MTTTTNSTDPEAKAWLTGLGQPNHGMVGGSMPTTSRAMKQHWDTARWQASLSKVAERKKRCG